MLNASLLWTCAGLLFEFVRLFENFYDVCEREDVWNCPYYKQENCYEFSAAIFIELLKFWCEVLPIVLGCMRMPGDVSGDHEHN